MPRLHLFQAYGVELEYMIVDRDSLAIKPIADELLKAELGSYGSDFENGMVTWSNELVLHVIELKSSKPENDLPALAIAFAENVKQINKILERWNAQLMPTAAHPFMNPLTEAKLWPHDNNEVYEVYNRIFDCKGHGWSNLQSTHLNLPFQGDEEFAKLHAAIRLVLPILPALCASSPITDGGFTGFLDTRLNYYKSNQQKIPIITGSVIPEPIFSQTQYKDEVYQKIQKQILPFDQDQILEPVWVNSRGAIPRFDRGSIEIRLMDVQECPAVDIAIVTLVIETIKALTEERFISFEEQTQFETEPLLQILESGITHAESALITNQNYLRVFGVEAAAATAAQLWVDILEALVANDNSALEPLLGSLKTLLAEGSLASRIRQSLKQEPAHNTIISVYKQLMSCLHQNRMFLP